MAPKSEPMAKNVMHPCKSIISKKGGNSFMVMNAVMLIVTTIIAIPMFRTCEKGIKLLKHFPAKTRMKEMRGNEISY